MSWDDAVEYANRLSARSGLEQCYQGDWPTFAGLDCTGLPTEAEWEYAARAGTTTTLYTGSLTISGERYGPQLDGIARYGGTPSARARN